MTIAIIGAGAIGSAIARQLARHGIPASIANSRGPQSLQALTAELGPHIRAVSIDQAAQAELVIVAVNWGRLPDALRALGPWNGRILVDANNAIEGGSFKAAELGGRASSAVVAELAPGARVVKAFNHLLAAVLSGDPQAEGGRRVLFLSGEDAAAKATVAELITRLGFAAVDLGDLDQGRAAQFPGGALPVLNLVKFG